MSRMFGNIMASCDALLDQSLHNRLSAPDAVMAL